MTQTTQHEEMNDDANGIDVNEIIEMFDSEKSNIDDELMYLQIEENEESSEEEENQFINDGGNMNIFKKITHAVHKYDDQLHKMKIMMIWTWMF